MYYGYLDESGDIALFSVSRYLVVAALLTQDPRPIELHIKRARAALGRKAKPDEFHAATPEKRVLERLLKAIVDEDIEISAVILDKATILKAPPDPEQLYREIVMQVVRDCVERHPRLEIWFDKRYTNKRKKRLALRPDFNLSPQNFTEG